LSTATGIQWTDATLNFWIGCEKVTAGCKNCYAETLAKGRMGLNVWGPAGTTERKPTKGVYADARKLQRDAVAGRVGVMGEGKPLLAFVGSLMDWAEDHPTAELTRARMWETIRACPGVHFQLLTKRPERIAKCLPEDWGDSYPNVWLGTSVEDSRVLWRVDKLMENQAHVHFLSVEPMIGEVTLPMGPIPSWVIVGSESGPGARPMNIEWARKLRDECAGKSAFFTKQIANAQDKKGGDPQFWPPGPWPREFPTVDA